MPYKKMKTSEDRNFLLLNKAHNITINLIHKKWTEKKCIPQVIEKKIINTLQRKTLRDMISVVE